MELLSYLLLFVLSAIPFVELFTTIPLGVFLMKLDPIPTALVSFSGNALGIIGFLILCTTMNKRVFYVAMEDSSSVKKQNKKRKKKELLQRTFQRFGLVGVAMIIPILISSHAGVLFNRTLGVTRITLLYWVIAGLAVWTTALTVACIWFPSMIQSMFPV